MVLFLLACAWAVVFARLVAFRATLSNATFATFALFGAIAGPPLATLVFKTIDPYGWTIDKTTTGYFFVQLAGALAIQATLLAPLWYLGVRRRAALALSVSDAFLLAFALGFGADALGLLVAASHGTAVASTLALLPPWQSATPAGTVAGNAYWLAAVALAWLATRRFVRAPQAANLVALLVFLWVAIERATVVTLGANGAPGPGDDGTFARLTFLWHGQFTAWIVTLAALALAFAERQRVAGALGAATSAQRGIVLAQIARTPADERLQRIAADLESRERIAAATGERTSIGERFSVWVSANRFAVAMWTAFALLAILVPFVPAFETEIWTFPALLTLLAFAAFFAAYLGTTVTRARPFDAEGFLRANGARALRIGALSVAMILVFSATLFAGLGAPITSILGAVPPLDPAHWTAYLLLFAAASVLSVCRPLAGLTEAASGPERVAFASNITTALGVYIVFWLDVWLFNAARAWFHQAAVNDQTYSAFGFNLQNAGDVLTAILVVLFSYLVYRILRAPLGWAQDVIAPRSAGG